MLVFMDEGLILSGPVEVGLLELDVIVFGEGL